ncbi:hypothetical protein K505DRAFT_189379, partial [Melanomma pulvis-pyrius CBS 109.77]
NPSGGAVAAWCKHPVHPSDGLCEGYCPVCEIRICLKYLDAVADMCSKTLSLDMRQAWRAARLHLQDAVNFHENEAKEEARWEVQYPNVNSMSRATFETLYAGTKGFTSKTGKAKKSVSFAPDT